MIGGLVVSLSVSSAIYTSVRLGSINGLTESYQQTWLPPVNDDGTGIPDVLDSTQERMAGDIDYKSGAIYGIDMTLTWLESLYARIQYQNGSAIGYENFVGSFMWRKYGLTIGSSETKGSIKLSESSVGEDTFNTGDFKSLHQFYALYFVNQYGLKRGLSYSTHTHPQLLLLYEAESRVSNPTSFIRDRVIAPSSLYFDKKTRFDLFGYYMEKDGPFNQLVRNYASWASGDYWFQWLMGEDAYMTFSPEGESIVGIARFDISDSVRREITDFTGKQLKMAKQYALGMTLNLRLPITYIQRYQSTRFGLSVGIDIHLHAYYKETGFHHEPDNDGIKVNSRTEVESAYTDNRLISSFVYGPFIKFFAAW